MNRLRVIPTSKLKKSASLQSPLAPMAATSTLYFNLFQSLSVKQRAWCWHDLNDLELVSNLQATKLGKPSEASFWPLNYFNAKLHDPRTLLHIAMIYQSIVHCIACYSNLHTYTLIHAGYCRISCTSSNIYNIGILNVPVMPPIPGNGVLLSISLWFERSSPHTIPLGNAMAWICDDGSVSLEKAVLLHTRTPHSKNICNSCFFFSGRWRRFVTREPTVAVWRTWGWLVMLR